MTSPAVSPLTDSPWFWACTFCTAALIALFLLEPKYGLRQAQIEKQYQGREFAARAPAGSDSTTAFSTPGHTLIRLGPLYWLFAVLLVATWGLFWWHRRRFVAAESTPRVRLPGASP